MKHLGKGKSSFLDAREVGVAAHDEGLRTPGVCRFKEAGADGTYEGNLERDTHRFARTFFGIPDIIYRAKIPIKNPATGRITESWISFLLSHELFGIMRARTPDLFHRVYGTARAAQFWDHMFRVDDEWLRMHPMREVILNDPEHACGFRLFGDETGLNKGSDRPCSILTVHAEGCELPTWQSKLPVLVMPDHFKVDQVTMPAVHEIMQWSFNIWATGKWPHHNHKGHPFGSRTWRGKRAGEWLTPERHRGIYLGTLADWKWVGETYHFQHTYKKTDLCHFCTASKRADARNFAHFCACPARSHATYMASLQAAMSPLTKTIGWHITTVWPEAMHAGPLGTCMILNGVCLHDLCDEGYFGDGGGPGEWKMRLRIQLDDAFDEFLSWSGANMIEHSQKRFTVAKLSLKTLKSFPLLKGKAHNELVVQQWMAKITSDVIHWHRANGREISEYQTLRACICWAWDTFFAVCRSAGPEFNDAEVAKLTECGTFMFHGWNEAASMSIRDGKPRWNMIPKHHAMWHVWSDAIRTRRNPAKQWAFMDEDAMQKISKIAMKCHGSSVNKRALGRWILHFFGEECI